jgi:hypothetical protein
MICREYLHPLYLDLGGGPTDSVLVAGSARSGTSWLADLLNFDGRYRYIFEPFRPDRVPLARPFWTRRYFRPSADVPDLQRAAGAILSGRIRNPWSDRLNRKRVARRRIVKDVWSNLMLGWLRRQFPEMPIVFIVRHPMAVVSSQLDLIDWKWEVDIPALFGQPALREDHLSPFQDEAARTTDSFDRHMLLWCVENLVPLRQLATGEAFVVAHEHLCTRPMEEIRRLFEFVGRPFSPAVERAVRRAAPGSREQRALLSGREVQSEWCWDELGRARLDDAMRLLEVFGLDRLYGTGPMPLLDDFNGAVR